MIILDKKKIKTNKNTFGKIAAFIQLILSIILVYQAGMLPVKYRVLLGVVLLAVFTVCFALQIINNKAHIIGNVISIMTIIVLAVGMFGLGKINGFMSAIGGGGLKTDNMVVVVNADDPAETIEDAAGYKFAIVKTIDRENTNKMLEEVENKTGSSLDINEYLTFDEMANALLNGEVEGAVYNSAFDGLIEDSIENYQGKIKVIYQYGIVTEVEAEVEKEVELDKGFNVYISGIDVSGPISTTSRSDVNIIMSINPDTKQILLTTTPRDYYVPIPGISGGVRDKLTHAGIYGVDASMRTLEELYGIDISYYARVNFTSLIKIVDILGGVDVNSEHSFSAQGYTFNKGVNHLNGEAALAFSRERYSFADGDNQRGRNQEAVIEAIINKALSPEILKRAGSILNSIGDSVETDMSTDEMNKLIAMQLSDNASWNIESQSVTGHGDTNSCFSSGSQQLYVMNPDNDSVSQASAKIREVVE